MSATTDYDGLCGIIHYYSDSQKQVRCWYDFGHGGPCSFLHKKVNLVIGSDCSTFYERLEHEKAQKIKE